MANIRNISSNRWFKFGIVVALYILFILWYGNYWWLLGVAVIFDIYVSKKVRWAFWKPRKDDKGAKKRTLEWVDAIVFAVIAATIIRVFFVEAYTIPTSSMEKTMMVGDFLFVSKTAYGPKVPNTPLSVPLVHNTLPLTKRTPSYVEWIRRPYRRLAGFGTVKRNDIVVFNFPEGDTVMMERQNESYYALVRQYGRENVQQGTIQARPVDKRENYIKRCVAIAGDTLQIINGQRFVNGIMRDSAPNMQKTYFVQTNGNTISSVFFEKHGIPKADRSYNPAYSLYELPLTKEQLAEVRKLAIVDTIIPHNNTNPNLYAQRVFPQTKGLNWTEDNYGPIWVPKRGSTVTLDSTTLPFYRRIISVYEHNQLEERADGIYINGNKSNTYTFQMNYYWMMGDNRHNSLDSRFWGFVPEDHVVGKASLVWMSLSPDKSFPFNIRWNRLFRIMK
ncbi:signal peptidase I [Bacteroidia bacterium]|nr:signal peptidase I [Bacteroidia bacterium]